MDGRPELRQDFFVVVKSVNNTRFSFVPPLVGGLASAHLAHFNFSFVMFIFKGQSKIEKSLAFPTLKKQQQKQFSQPLP